MEGFVANLMELGKCPNVYVKLSGLFNILPEKLLVSGLAAYTAAGDNPDSILSHPAVIVLKAYLSMAIKPLVDSFGTDRLVFASNWPVDWFIFERGAPSLSGAKQKLIYAFTTWIQVSVLEDVGVDEKSMIDIFEKNARKLYKV